MAHTKTLLFLLISITFHVSIAKPSNQEATNSFEAYTIQVIDSKIEHLVAHISSHDTEFGNKTMTINDAFHWSFRRNYDETTVFRGEFFWMKPDGTPYMEVDFHVFDNDVAVKCGQSILKAHKCFWMVSDTGFYFAKDNPSGWVLVYKWPEASM